MRCECLVNKRKVDDISPRGTHSFLFISEGEQSSCIKLKSSLLRSGLYLVKESGERSA